MTQRKLFLIAMLISAKAWTTEAQRSMLFVGKPKQKLRGDFDATLAASSVGPRVGSADNSAYSQQQRAEWAAISEAASVLMATSSGVSREQPLLPPALRPEVSYFDATHGVSIVDSDSQTVMSWSTVYLEPDQDTNILWMDGDCRLLQPANGEPVSVLFDGQACSGHTDYGVPLPWDNSPRGNFSAVWIGRAYDSGADLHFPDQTSRTPFGFARRMYAGAWESAAAASGEDEDGREMSAEQLIPPPPPHRWTMEVVTRSSSRPSGGGGKDDLTMSYYRYGSGDDGLSAWRFAAAPSEFFASDMLVVGFDLRDGRGYFYGELSVALLYNRPLDEREVRELARFYAPRFGLGGAATAVAAEAQQR